MRDPAHQLSSRITKSNLSIAIRTLSFSHQSCHLFNYYLLQPYSIYQIHRLITHISINKFIMETKYCDTHQRSACIVDLDLSQLVCERCALFDPLYSTHKFIDLESLPQHAIKLYREFQKDIASLNITVDKDAVSNWRIIDQLAIEIFKQKSKQLNATYDEMVAEIERQRKESMSNLQQKIDRIVSESNHSVNYLVREKYHQLYCKNKYLDECIKDKKYLQVTNELLDKTAKAIIGQIDKELSIIEIDLRHKFKSLDYSELSETFCRRTTFTKDEMLLPQEEKPNEIEIDLDINTQKIIINEHCKTQVTFANPETDRVSARSPLHIKNKSVDLDAPSNDFSTPQHSVDLSNLQMSSSLILPSTTNKNSKQLINKSEIKTIVLKNNIKQVNMASLLLNNREALQAIRKCTFGTFVNRIDLSGNELTSQVLVLLKKEKIQSKYLKTLVMRGMKVDERVLKKQGFNLEKIGEGRIQMGEIVIEIM